jgi:acetate kinase
MRILVFNCGSSSLTYKVFDWRLHDRTTVLLRGKAHRVGVKGVKESFIENYLGDECVKETVSIPDHETAAQLAMDFIQRRGIAIDGIGSRFVHGGNYFKESALIDPSSLRKLEQCLPLAPLHNPIALAVIKESMNFFSRVPQYAVFDSAFHSQLPPKAYLYPVPNKIAEKYQFRKFGFHGLSYAYVARQVPRLLNADPGNFKMIACHLGTGGSSVAAVKDGVSVDTSMGFSPLSGLMMSTRSGDLDPMLALYFMSHYGYQPADLMNLLNKKSGLLGISGFSSDITDLIDRLSDAEFKTRAELALKMYIHRLRKYIGSYVVTLRGAMDALVFTDDIGLNNPYIRERVCEKMEWAGIRLDPEQNRRAVGDRITFLNAVDSPVKIVSIPTEEEYVIFLEGIRMLGVGHATFSRN